MSWVNKQNIPTRKKKLDYFSWIDDKRHKGSIRDFA